MAARSRLVEATVIASGIVLAAVILVPSLGRSEAEPVAEGADQGVDATIPTLALTAAMAGFEQAETEAVADQPVRPRTGVERRAGRSRRTLSPELIDKCIEVARDVDPQLAEELELIRAERPPADVARAIANARNLRGLAGLRDQDPKLYDVKINELRLDARVERLLEQLIEARRAGSPSADNLEVQLRAQAERQVGYSLAARGMYLGRLKDQVKALREKLEDDLGNFEDAVERRMTQLLDEVEAARNEPPTPSG